jgi:hypothetical protein
LVFGRACWKLIKPSPYNWSASADKIYNDWTFCNVVQKPFVMLFCNWTINWAALLPHLDKNNQELIYSWKSYRKTHQEIDDSDTLVHFANDVINAYMNGVKVMFNSSNFVSICVRFAGNCFCTVDGIATRFFIPLSSTRCTASTSQHETRHKYKEITLLSIKKLRRSYGL